MVGAGATVPVGVPNAGLESGDATSVAVPPPPPPAAVLRVPSVLEAEAKNGHGAINGTMRIPARVPPTAPEPVVVVRPHNIPNIPPPVSDAAIPLVPASAGDATFVVSQAVAREQSFRVRTALTKGWRKGKKSRKSVGGGRGPGFTSREVDGLLDLLEEAVPVTREEWEQVRGKHAERFPGTSRSIDSIRRKFAKVYLARGPAGNMVDGHTAPVVRRAKCIRERMAARAVSLDDEDASMEHAAVPGAENNTAVGHVEAMDTTGLHDGDDNDDEHEEHHLPPDNEGNASNVQEQVLEAVPTATGLAPVSLSMVVNDLATNGDAAPLSGDNSVPVQEEAENMNTSPGRPPPRKKQNTGIGGGAGEEEENLLSVFKMYIAQESQNRDEERRIRAEEREQQKNENKAREEREVRRHEQFMQMLMVVAQKQQTPRDP